jgi:hypothetical protein
MLAKHCEGESLMGHVSSHRQIVWGAITYKGTRVHKQGKKLGREREEICGSKESLDEEA